MTNHSLHHFHTSFEWSRVPSSFNWLFFFLLLMMWSLFFILTLFFKLLDIGVPDFPLSDFTSKIICYWRASCSSSCLNWRIDCLDLSIFIVEFIFHSLLNRFNIFSRSWLFLFGLTFHLFKFGFSYILNFLLNLVFIRRSVDVVSLLTKMYDELIDRLVFFIFPFKIVIHDSIRFSLWVWNN